jgi:hypothetical protein
MPDWSGRAFKPADQFASPKRLVDTQRVQETGLRWPFVRVLNALQKPTSWLLINGPIVTREQQNCFARLRRSGCRFAGMSSYINFPESEPDAISGGAKLDALDYEAVCEVWRHCFRDPTRSPWMRFQYATFRESAPPSAIGTANRA